MNNPFENLPKNSKIRFLPHELDYLTVPLDMAKSFADYVADCPICEMKVCTLCGANGHTPANCPWSGKFMSEFPSGQLAENYMLNVRYALTLVITNRDLKKKSVDDRTVPEIYQLKGTLRDVLESDRVVYVDPTGKETYIKDRWPKEEMPVTVQVIELRIIRPDLPTVESRDAWINRIRTYRKNIYLTGAL